MSSSEPDVRWLAGDHVVEYMLVVKEIFLVSPGLSVSYHKCCLCGACNPEFITPASA